jgi:hypothetical protein
VLIALDDIQLRVGSGHQQFEHEVEVVAVAVVAQFLETRGLPAIHRLVILGIVAHQDLDEGGFELLDMRGVLRAELELKFGLTAFFRRHRGDQAIGGCIAQDTRAKLLIDEDAGPFLRQTSAESKLKPVIYNLFGPGDALGLIGAQRPAPSIKTFFEGAAMVKRQNVQRLIISGTRVVAHACFPDPGATRVVRVGYVSDDSAFVGPALGKFSD